LQREIDVIDDAIADEQLLSPSLRDQVTIATKFGFAIDPATKANTGLSSHPDAG